MHTERTHRTGPLISAGTLLGLGMGGFLDGILLHQVLQWHQMISARLPPDTLENSKVNMFWDGIFHIGTWTLTALGLGLLWRVGNRPEVPRSGAIFAGSLIFGWGLFNLLDSIFDHYLFRLHNIRENVSNPMLWNHAFTALSIALLAAGWLMIRSGRAALRTV